MNTVIPYQDPVYYDSRKTVGVAQEEVLPISDELAATIYKRLRQQQSPCL